MHSNQLLYHTRAAKNTQYTDDKFKLDMDT